MAEWSKAAVSKTVNPLSRVLGFESPSLRKKTQKSAASLLVSAFFMAFCKAPRSGAGIAQAAKQRSGIPGEMTRWLAAGLIPPG